MNRRQRTAEHGVCVCVCEVRWAGSVCMYCDHVRFCAHLRSSARGLQPVTNSMSTSRALQNRTFSSGQFSQPVVMQKQVSCGATWWMRWWRRGKMMWCSCRNTTQLGRPKYVWDHLCICICKYKETYTYIHVSQKKAEHSILRITFLNVCIFCSPVHFRRKVYLHI